MINKHKSNNGCLIINLSLDLIARCTAITCRLNQTKIAATAPSMARVVANFTIGRLAKAIWALVDFVARSVEGVLASVLAGEGVSSTGGEFADSVGLAVAGAGTAAFAGADGGDETAFFDVWADKTCGLP